MPSIDIRKLSSIQALRQDIAERIKNNLLKKVEVSRLSREFKAEHPNFLEEKEPITNALKIESETISEPTSNTESDHNEKQEEQLEKTEEQQDVQGIAGNNQSTGDSGGSADKTSVKKKKTTKRKKNSEENVETTEKKTRRKILLEREGTICVEEEKPTGESEHSESSN